ncbi:hypothetical protein [Streptomyces sp. NPDC051677]
MTAHTLRQLLRAAWRGTDPSAAADEEDSQTTPAAGRNATSAG